MALQVNPRHYPASLDLSGVQEKLGNLDKALKIYVTVERINLSNAVLMKYIARVG